MNELACQLLDKKIMVERNRERAIETEEIEIEKEIKRERNRERCKERERDSEKEQDG